MFLTSMFRDSDQSTVGTDRALLMVNGNPPPRIDTGLWKVLCRSVWRLVLIPYFSRLVWGDPKLSTTRAGSASVCFIVPIYTQLSFRAKSAIEPKAIL